MSNDCMCINIPECGICLRPGMKIKIGRFSNTIWRLDHGWFSFSGNRPICGWFLTDMTDNQNVRPLQKSDLADIYSVEC